MTVVGPDELRFRDFPGRTTSDPFKEAGQGASTVRQVVIEYVPVQVSSFASARARRSCTSSREQAGFGSMASSTPSGPDPGIESRRGHRTPPWPTGASACRSSASFPTTIFPTTSRSSTS